MTLQILILCSLFTISLAENACDMDKLSANPSCFFNSTDQQCGSFTEKNIFYKLTDSVNGVFEVMFPISSPSCHKYNVYEYVYRVTLSVQETVGPIEDNNTTMKDAQFLKHSELEYQVTNISSADIIPCTKNATFVFKYIFTGRYKLRISPFGTSESPIIIDNIDLKTQYVKATMADYVVNFYVEPRPQDVNVVVIHPFLENRKSLRFDIYCNNCDHYIPMGFTHSIITYPNKSETDKKVYNLEVCHIKNIFNKSPELLPRCQYINQGRNSSIECFYHGMAEGNYTFEFEILGDVRCNQHTLWLPPELPSSMAGCKWNYNRYVSYPVPVEPTTDMDNGEPDFPLIYSLIMGSCLVAILAIVIYFIMRKSRRPPPIFDPPEEVIPINTSKVFLLYARDCPKFMETMEAFRTVLSIVGKFEVFDIHDNIRFKEIASSPDHWIKEKLLNCKTILILTECADLQYGNHNHRKSLYKQRDCLDGYFISALQYINHDSGDIASYKKLLVVNLSFDRKDYKSFKLLNPYTRFDLPDSFSKLVADLKDESLPDHTNEEAGRLYENTCAFSIFLRKYHELEEYVKKKPYYLEEILKVEASTEINV